MNKEWGGWRNRRRGNNNKSIFMIKTIVKETKSKQTEAGKENKGKEGSRGSMFQVP